MKLAIGLVLGAAAAFALTTWWALESSDVGTLTTRSPDGTPRSTHVWFAEPDGELWLEAGTPENSWYLDVRRHPLVSFSSVSRSGEYLAKPLPGPSAHDRIRSLLREKYGFRDWWIALVFDTSRSVAVLLAPEARADP